MPHISNLNSVSIKNYPAENETLALLRELRKLGLIKLASKSKPKSKPLINEDIKQTSNMVSSSKSLNNFPLRLATAGMTQQQIEDINTRNAANIAVLTGELKQQRLEDIEAQQGQRFADISRLSSIINPALERFRGSTFPAQQQGSKPVDPFSYARGNAPIGLEYTESDIEEGRFTGGINEGAPAAVSQKPTETFASDEDEEEENPDPRIKIQQKISGDKKKVVIPSVRAEFVLGLGLGPVPKRKGSSVVALKQYYTSLANVTDRPINENIRSKEDLFNEIYRIIDEETSSV